MVVATGIEPVMPRRAVDLQSTVAPLQHDYRDSRLLLSTKMEAETGFEPVISSL